MFFYLFIVLPLLVSANLHERFEEWAQKHSFKFENDEHKQHVLSNWIDNDKHIDTVNAMNLTYTLGHNQFSGMNGVEFKEYVGFDMLLNNDITHVDMPDIKKFKCIKQCVDAKDDSNTRETINCVSTCLHEESVVQLADSVDWVSKGGVTPVKNQGQCGSCWSFSTTGALEGAYYVKYNTLPSFSEQQLVDCDNFQHGGRDHGCNGGLMDNAFSWIKNNDGLCSEESYPYVSGDTRKPGTCETTCDNIKNSKINSYVDVQKSSDSSMMEALMQQPVSIAIQADQKDFQLYKSGVFTGSCGTQLDHGVLAVGYGSSNGEDFYLVKNSWGTSWGDNGYIKLGRGNSYNNGNGQCGMLMQASYPEL